MIAPNLLRSAAAAAALTLALGACGSDSKTASKPADSSPAAGASSDKIEVKDFSFKPAAATVKAGTTVTWTFSDSSAHNVDPVGGTEPKKSPDLKSGGTYTFTFTKAGTYNYRCGIHNSMTGSVVVTA
jgi:plastocyanin